VQTWEYLEVEVDVTSYARGWSDSRGRDGELSRGAFSAAVCNEVGAQGWELTGVAAGHPGIYRLFFKRPRA
jgi:hypothetical protein